MPTLNGITYYERPGSAHMEYSHEDGWRGVRIFYIDWADRQTFCEALLGHSEEIGDTSIRVLGQQFPGYDYLIARLNCTPSVVPYNPGEPGRGRVNSQRIFPILA